MNPDRSRQFPPPCGEARLAGFERRAIARAGEGDWDAVTFLYARYLEDVLGYVRGIVGDSHEAEDITQSVFARLPTAIRRYEERDATFAAWLFRVARNATLDHLRARRQIPVEEIRLSDWSDQHTDSERVQTLRHALSLLPTEQREVLVLRHIIGLSPGEIADRLGRSESSVHGLHHRGRQALKLSLSELDTAPVTVAV